VLGSAATPRTDPQSGENPSGQYVDYCASPDEWPYILKEAAVALPALVLVHGGGLAADSWDLTIGQIHRSAPELTVLALDMPGRRNKPGDLREMTIADYVDSLVGDIESAGLEDIVIVGHSMGAMPLPGVVTKLGAPRVREMIFAAALLPPEGTSIVDSSPWLSATMARRAAKRNVPGPTPKWMARFVYMNGVPSHRRRFMTDKLYAESLRILTEKVFRRGMPDDIPRTWIMTLRDRILAPKVQRRYIDGLGGVQTLIEIDTCHMLMVSEPQRLAEILVERCRLYE
jgi:pimeloyl-ACP methyl ester carboxylesterase